MRLPGDEATAVPEAVKPVKSVASVWNPGQPDQIGGVFRNNREGFVGFATKRDYEKLMIHSPL
jgi:hypothetical protein